MPRRFHCHLAAGWLGACLLLAATPASGDDAATPGGVRFGEAKTQRWQVGVMVTSPATGYCQNVLATVPVPTDWPEQEVKEVARDLSGHVTVINFRVLENGVKQMLVGIPAIPPGQTAQAVLTYEVTRREIIGPSDPSGYSIPKRVPRDVNIFLGTSPSIESRHEEIRDLARQLVSDDRSGWENSRAIFDWVRTNVTYTDGNLKGALAALRDKSGDCEELTSLFIALCRASKIPARTVWIPDHCYPEFYLLDPQGQGHWFPCEMTGGDYFGSLPAIKPVLQKGDNFKVPEKSTPQRYVAEHLKIKNVTGSGDPEVRFIRKLLDE